MKPIAVAAVLIAAACSPMDQYVDGQIVRMDGEHYLIRKLSNGSYQAMRDDPKAALHVEAADRASNVQAVEKSTGVLSILRTGLTRAAELLPL
jgi:hypothetical protein